MLVGLLALGGALPASARQGDAPRAAVELILDSSGSMAADAGDGRSRMQVAEQALRQVVDALPERGLHVGLRVYGHRVGNAEELKDEGCRDTELVVPVGPLDRAALRQASEAFTPSGYTPIGLSLREAAEDLAAADGVQRTVVLVSDGRDTCAPPDPCDVAAELADRAVGISVHAIGFQVDPPAREQLRCIADATGGTYRDAPDAASLADALRALALRTYRTYQPVGEPVRGAATVDEAPTLEPGRYVDVLREGEARYWLVDVAPGATVTAVAQLVTGPDKEPHAAEFAGSLIAPDVDDRSPDPRTGCDSYLDLIQDVDTAPAAATGARVTAERDGSGCSAPGRYVFAVRYSHLLGGPDGAEVGVELAVTAARASEGRPATPGSSPAGTASPGPTPAGSVTGGGGPDDGSGGGPLWWLALLTLPVGGVAGWRLGRSRP